MRPIRIRQLQQSIRNGRRRLMHPDLKRNKALMERIVNAPVYLSRSHHTILGLDMDNDGYSLQSVVAAKRRKREKEFEVSDRR